MTWLTETTRPRWRGTASGAIEVFEVSSGATGQRGAYDDGGAAGSQRQRQESAVFPSTEAPVSFDIQL